MANAPDIKIQTQRPDLRQPARSATDPRVATSHPGLGRLASPAPPRTEAREQLASLAAGPGARPELPEADRLADAIDVVGQQIGRVYGYLRTRTSAGMRSDAERLIVDNGVLTLAAAFGLGYVVGRLVRR